MLKNKKFGGYTILIAVLGLIAQFFYSGLMNDHLNILSVVLGQQWSQSQIYLGNNIGGYIVIVLYLLFGIGFIKIGVKKLMVPTIGILGIATMLLGLVGDAGNFAVYTILLTIVRCGVVPLQMGFFMLCANWYIKYRGRMLGIITIGSPVFSVVGINVLSALCANGITTGYMIFGGLVVVLDILLLVFIKDKPEDAGLYPDGSDHAPISESGEGDDSIDMSLGEILREGRAWQLIVSYGILQAVIAVMMGSMAMRYVWAGNGFGAGTEPMIYLSIGAALGIPMSYILGVIDDKMGSIKASFILNILYFFCVIPFVLMPWDMTTGASPAMMLVWAFGVACMTGGCPTMHPSVTSYVYGRRRYQAANKWIMTIQAIIMACGLPIMNALYDMGKPQIGYWGLLISLVISLIVIISMKNIPDANLEDREYGQKK